MVLTARLKPHTPGIIAARQGGTLTLFLPPKASSAMLTESSPIRRPPPDIPQTRSCSAASPLSLPLWARPPRPLSAKGERDRRPGSCDGQHGMQSLKVYLATIVVSCAWWVQS